MLKRILAILITLNFFLSACNDATKKPENGIDKVVVKSDTSYSINTVDAVSLDGEQDIRTVLCQNWMNVDDAETLAETDDNSSLLLPIRTFDFFGDNTVVKNYRNKLDYGSWDFDAEKKVITIRLTSSGEKMVYKIASIAADELNVKNNELNTSTILNFEASGYKLKNINDEPFHMYNNGWRLAPHKKESDDQVKQRLKDNLHFFILFYKSALAKNDKTVSFYGLPSCLKWYGGGIYMMPKKDINPEWIKCFYNKDQAMQAYALMEKLMDKKYNWPKENISWVKKNLVVLEQMYANLEAMN
jgi:hypothetical protein